MQWFIFFSNMGIYASDYLLMTIYLSEVTLLQRFVVSVPSLSYYPDSHRMNCAYFFWEQESFDTNIR